MSSSARTCYESLQGKARSGIARKLKIVDFLLKNRVFLHGYEYHRGITLEQPSGFFDAFLNFLTAGYQTKLAQQR